MTSNSPNGKTIDSTLGNGSKDPSSDADGLLGSLIDTGKHLLHDYKETLERAIEKSMETRAAEAKYGSPGSGRIKVRREGIFGKPNERDLARVEAEKANRDRATLNAQHLADLGKYAASGKKYVMDVVAYMKDTDEDLPEDLQPIGQALTKISTKILTGTYAESLTMLSAMGMEENAQATKPGQQ